jgi:hypothetical protein
MPFIVGQRYLFIGDTSLAPKGTLVRVVEYEERPPYEAEPLYHCDFPSGERNGVYARELIYPPPKKRKSINKR